MKCKIKGCSKKVVSKKTQLCKSHYGRLWKHGDAYGDVSTKKHSSLSLATRRKILQAKPGFRYCRYCNKYKKIKAFPEAYLYMCKLCQRDITLKNKYGIGNKEYNKLLKEQKGKCALCGTKDPGKTTFFCVDHDHQTNTIRGLLCRTCNGHIIGKIESKKIPINCLVEYLRKAIT